MKVYLVGGAVRDQLLGYPVHERDWVVVGETPESLLKQGFTQVGHDFPVFIHPKTREEYALARTERKQSAGYYGFACHADPTVTLEEDLARRDLTINAMAMDEKGVLVDPFNGVADLHSKILRHVSPAFVEDPVRVLRLARFTARYHHLGFTVAEETRRLMVSMVQMGELSHLVPERVWQELIRSLSERDPEYFILVLRSCGALRVVVPEWDALFGIPNRREIYPPIDSGLQALDALINTAKITDDPSIRFAALCHVIGHVDTPMALWPNHPNQGSALHARMENLSQRLRIPHDTAHLARLAAQWIPSLNAFVEQEAEAIVCLMEACDAFRRPSFFEQLVLIADAVMRNPDLKNGKNWLNLRDNCGKISAKTLIDQGYQGAAIKKGLHEKRVAFVQAWKSNEKQ